MHDRVGLPHILVVFTIVASTATLSYAAGGGLGQSSAAFAGSCRPAVLAGPQIYRDVARQDCAVQHMLNPAGGRVMPGETVATTFTPTVTPTATSTTPPAVRAHLPLVARNLLGPVPSPTPTPTVVPILFVDDFSDPHSGWPIEIRPNAEVGYQDGEYRAFVGPVLGRGFAGRHNRVFDNFDLDVSVRALNPPFSGAYLLMFRYENDLNYYYARISPSEGTYDIYKVVDGVRTQLISSTEASAIQAGTATNHLRLVAQGSTVRLYVNGQFLGGVDDSSMDSGSLALGAWNFTGEHSITVHWDNLVVYRSGARPLAERVRPARRPSH